MTNENIQNLRKLIEKKNLSAYMLPSQDEFQGEYVPDSAKRLSWLTGFTGSNGSCVLAKKKAAFFTDGRYVLQAESQVDQDVFSLNNLKDYQPIDWINDNFGEGDAVGFDPFLFSMSQIKHYRAKSKMLFRDLAENLIDKIWTDRPKCPASEIKLHPAQYAGYDAEYKLQLIRKSLKADYYLICDPSSICWLLNIRGDDIAFTPYKLAYCLVSADDVTLFVNTDFPVTHIKIPNLTILPRNAMERELSNLSYKQVSLDPAKTPYWFQLKLEELNSKIEADCDPCTFYKACKNSVELEGMRECHIVDGLALTKFLVYLQKNIGKLPFTELSIAEELLKFRKEALLFVYPSFGTIAGYKDHGAIIHYQASAESSYKIEADGMLLIDSGGQYFNGTTDVTRTITLGEPNQEQKDMFTRVLKGHIAIAMCKFPRGTSGAQLDILARKFLWEVSADYDHGTGHGVGSYLSVHEGPQSISKRGAQVALEAGMIISNEPGYYKAGEYGIRIESLVEVVELNEGYLGFNTITSVPIDLKLINRYIMTDKEIEWLNQYHQNVFDNLSSKTDDAGFIADLKKLTQKI